MRSWQRGWNVAVRSRLPWLYVNLLTAFLAGGVVYVFQGTVQRTITLAVWMPMIAGMGGNAGTQALAVTVRRLALGLIPGHLVRPSRRQGGPGRHDQRRVDRCRGRHRGRGAGRGHAARSRRVSCDDGNLLVAGFAGAFIPIVLERLDVDPAIASSIFVTTFTDVCGFLLLLGLAGALLL